MQGDPRIEERTSGRSVRRFLEDRVSSFDTSPTLRGSRGIVERLPEPHAAGSSGIVDGAFAWADGKGRTKDLLLQSNASDLCVQAEVCDCVLAGKRPAATQSRCAGARDEKSSRLLRPSASRSENTHRAARQ